VTGLITFEENAINSATKGQTISLPFNGIRRIAFIIRGRRRSSYWPIIYGPIGVNLANGTGNLIEIETADNHYKLDVFLKNSFEENALNFHIKRLADSGIKIEKRKLPAILGDSI
jgi:hypothetical protein